MKLRVIGLLFLGNALLMPAAWAEEPAYKAADIIKLFQPAMNGKTRGICVGTAQECGTPDEAKKPLTFDLMVNFDLNSSRLTESAKANLREFSKALSDSSLSSAKFAIEGYTDASGTEAYNQGLSERRAQAVVSFLVDNGIDSSRLIPEGFGETNPRVADPLDPVNRRVETKLYQQ